jgi:hypothetical protein
MDEDAMADDIMKGINAEVNADNSKKGQARAKREVNKKQVV